MTTDKQENLHCDHECYEAHGYIHDLKLLIISY